MTVATHSVRVSRVIRADRESLFRAWTDPAELARWWRQQGEGWAFSGASVDLRVGGAYRLGMTGPDGRNHVAAGEYREVIPPARLVFTWDWADPANRVGDTLVSVDFIPVGGDSTEVVITHERFVDPARIGRHKEGWTELLQLLDQAISQHEL